MDKKLKDTLCEQINNELYSAYIYLSMAAYFEDQNLSGFASWMKNQSKEEVSHGMKIFEYLCDRGQMVALDQIKKPPANFSSPLDVFKKTLEHEKKVTDLIYKLYELAQKKKDHATAVMLQWFIDEQVEEEKSAQDILDKLKFVKPNTAAMLMLDQSLAKRKE